MKVQKRGVTDDTGTEDPEEWCIHLFTPGGRIKSKWIGKRIGKSLDFRDVKKVNMQISGERSASAENRETTCLASLLKSIKCKALTGDGRAGEWTCLRKGTIQAN